MRLVLLLSDYLVKLVVPASRAIQNPAVLYWFVSLGIIIVWWISPHLIRRFTRCTKLPRALLLMFLHGRRGIINIIFHDFGTNCMVPSDWCSAPRCVCDPNFIFQSGLIRESPIFPAARLERSCSCSSSSFMVCVFTNAFSRKLMTLAYFKISEIEWYCNLQILVPLYYCANKWLSRVRDEKWICWRRECTNASKKVYSSQNPYWDCYGSFDKQRLFSVKFARFRNFFDFAKIWGILESDKLWEIQCWRVADEKDES